MKKIPQGMFRDTEFGNAELRVLYYDSRTKCYRIEYQNMAGMRRWVHVEELGPGKRFQSMGYWGFLLRQKVDLRAGRPVLNVADACLV